MVSKISDYYRDVVANYQAKVISSPEGEIVKTSHTYTLSRGDFLSGACLATLFLAKEVALLFFDFFNFESHGKQALAYLGAIPIGYFGVFFPETVRSFLGVETWDQPRTGIEEALNKA